MLPTSSNRSVRVSVSSNTNESYFVMPNDGHDVPFTHEVGFPFQNLAGWANFEVLWWFERYVYVSVVACPTTVSQNRSKKPIRSLFCSCAAVMILSLKIARTEDVDQWSVLIKV